jgi:endonuclease/exonuclease/phosphatase family metal-dependent hydrolase
VRVAVFNIRGGRGMDERTNLARTAGAVASISGGAGGGRSLDVLALNEVHGGGLLGGPDQAAQLAALLKMPYLFAPTERRWWHEDFGNGVLCALPVTSWTRLPISTDAARGYRNLLLLRVPLGGRTMNVLITHLERRGEREPGMRLVGEMFRSLEPPAVLLGDLNAMPGESPALESLRHGAGVADVLTRPGLKHQDTCWILARGMDATDAGSVDDGASDHPLFWADLSASDSR